MTRNELIAIENVISNAVTAIDRYPVLALEHARDAYRMLGTMLTPGITGIVVKDLYSAELVDGLDPHDVANAILNAQRTGNGTDL